MGPPFRPKPATPHFTRGSGQRVGECHRPSRAPPGSIATPAERSDRSLPRRTRSPCPTRTTADSDGPGVAHGGASHPAEAGNPTFRLSFPKERATGGRVSPCVACATREYSDAGRLYRRGVSDRSLPRRTRSPCPTRTTADPDGPGVAHDGARNPSDARQPHVTRCPREGNRLRLAEYYRVTCADGSVARAALRRVAHGGASCPAEAGNPTSHPRERATGRRMSPSVACAGGSVARPTRPGSPRSECAAEPALSGSRTRASAGGAGVEGRDGPVRRIASRTEVPETPCEIHPGGGNRS